MVPVIGGFLPFAIGVALSPTPIAAVVLMLNAPRGAIRATIFSLGSVLGVAFVAGLASIAAAPMEVFAGAIRYPSAALSIALILVGIAMIAVAIVRWRRGRPNPDAQAAGDVLAGTSDSRSFLAKMQESGPLRAFLIGFALSAFTVKNLGLTVAAGIIIGSGHLQPAGALVAVGVFAVIARITLIAPILLLVFQRERATRVLSSMSAWFSIHGSTVTLVVLLVLGVTAVGAGLSGL